MARQFGLKIIEPKPALVPFTLDEKTLSETKNLSGVSVNGIASCGKINFREGILFTHFGLSGPAILQISSYWKKGDKITINLAPEINVFEKLQEEKKSKPKQELQNFLGTFLPKSLANYLAQKSNHSGNLADLSNQKIKEIADSVNAWSFIPKGTEGFAKAEVTIGGINTDEISSKTFEVKSVPNLFFIGEVLDVTGWLGGFNFQWAWASGKAAGEVV
jgi:predicted Rossmann fold flavoprotein